MPPRRTKQCTIRYYVAERATTDGAWPRDNNVVAALRNALDRPAQPHIEHGGRHYIVETHNVRPALHVSVATVRRDGLPMVERRGATHALDLDADENLAEPTHVVFAGTGAHGEPIVALVRSQYTPGHLIAGNVLGTRTGVDTAFVPILRPEIQAILQNSLVVTELELRVAGSSVDAASTGARDPVEAAHRLIDGVPGSEKATVKLTARSGPQRQRLRQSVIRLLERGVRKGHYVEMARARIIGRDGGRELVDLLEDQMAHTVTVPNPSETRHLDPDAIRGAVRSSFNEQRAALGRALEIQRASP